MIFNWVVLSRLIRCTLSTFFFPPLSPSCTAAVDLFCKQKHTTVIHILGWRNRHDLRLIDPQNWTQRNCFLCKSTPFIVDSPLHDFLLSAKLWVTKFLGLHLGLWGNILYWYTNVHTALGFMNALILIAVFLKGTSRETSNSCSVVFY